MAAAQEAVQTRAWYSHFSDRAEQDFTAALRSAFELIRAAPGAGLVLWDDYRRVLVSGYPYAIIYRLRDTELIVVAVAHTSRKPGYWRRRR